MALSPMMKQYLQTKEKYKDTILLYRLGDFYEMFFDDAILASKELELTLTGRDCGLDERAPMCGVPHHAVDSYIAKLVQKGFKVAVCEQLTEPNQGKIIERDVVKVVTAGTITQSEVLDDGKNNYLMSIFYEEGNVGVSWTDITTGEFSHLYIDAPAVITLNDLLLRVAPSEIICNNSALEMSLELSIVKFGSVCPFSLFDDINFERENALIELKSQLCDAELKMLLKKKLCVNSAGGLLAYIKATQMRTMSHIKNVLFDDEEAVMQIDDIARKTLELTKNSKDGGTANTILGHLSRVSTGMGKRYLKKLVERPSLNLNIINDRLSAVEELCLDNSIMRDKLRIFLAKIRDIERIASEISRGDIEPKKCLGLADSLTYIPKIKEVLDFADSGLLKNINQNISLFNQVVDLIVSAIVDQEKKALNQEAGGDKSRDGEIIRQGFDSVLDEYIGFALNVNETLSNLEAFEKAETGIKGLRISYNRVFGYFIEVPKSQVGLVPYRYVRKQTVASGERYTIDELKEIEEKMLSSLEMRQKREKEIYELIIDELKKYVDELLSTAKALAYLDCLVAFGEVSQEFGYVKPEINGEINHIKIVEGRHCIVEKNKGERFVPNDTYINNDSDKIMVITGPNMAGKSVYMRQVALITILAHIGCFVPAKSAAIALTDRIFTRVGASDDIATGRSTFMVEMSEVANILQNATNNSLILLDEVGRGTSTYDGLSIAWAIIEYLAKNTNAKTLFSTHYHEITELEGIIEGVKNYKLTLRELNGNIIFLRKLMRGSANKSFGIEVAGLAGLPDEVLIRAKEVLKLLENADINRQTKLAEINQLSIFNAASSNVANEIMAIVKDIDTDNLTPRHALDILIDLKEKVKKNG